MASPFWSIMIPAYNCAHTLPRTIESVIAATNHYRPLKSGPPGALQIEVIDDCSTSDDTKKVADTWIDYGVTYFRQPRNVGATENYNTCISRARGAWVHILHGDDYVHPDFYLCLEEGIASQNSVRVAFTSFVAVDEFDNPKWHAIHLPLARGLVDAAWRDVIAVHNRIMAPAIVVRRDAYSEVGNFNTSLFHAADWDMWKRLIWKYDTWFEPRELAYYLIHTESDSSKLMRSGANLRDSLRAIKLAKKLFPIGRREELSREARRTHADLGIRTADRFLDQKDYRAALAQICESFLLVPSIVVRQVPAVVLRRAKHRCKSLLRRLLAS